MSEAQGNAAFGIPDDVVAPTEPRDAHGLRKEYFEIEVYTSREKGAESIVKVGVNGRVWKIQRGIKVIVPRAVLESLDHAVQDVTVQGEGGLVTQPAHRFPYWSRPATEAEYHAFQGKMRAQTVARQQQAAA